MKKQFIFTFGLIIIALIGGFLVWNFDANTASAQKNESAEGVNLGVATEYNARNEFALTQGGTSGVWRYGYSASPTDNAFTEFTVSDTIPLCGGNFERWYVPNADVIPQIARHNLAATCSNIPPEALFIHPGYTTRAVLRWTAPAAGTYQLTGALQRQNGNATTDLKIIKNAATANESVIYSASNVSTYQIAYNVTVTVAQGDKLDFSVGDGGNGFNGDGSSIVVNISQPVTACQTTPANLQVFVPGENSPSDVQSVNTNASLVGDATYTNMGKVGRAFSFDGNGDYVRIEDNLAQRPANAFTLEGWFKFNATPGTTILISKPRGAGSDNSFALFTENGILKGVVQNSILDSSYSPPANQWNHIAYTFDDAADTHKLFVNGIEVASGAIAASVTYDNSPLLIGAERDNGVFSAFFNGQADEVSIYGRSLAQTEIFDIVQQGSFGKCPPANCVQSPNNLVSWFAGEQNALDSRSNNHGQLQNGATFADGKVGQGFDIPTPGDFISVPDSPSLRPTNLTLEGWFNFSVAPSSVQVLASKNAATGNSFVIYYDNGFLRGQTGNGGTFGNPVSLAFTPTVGQWYHIAYTWQSGGNEVLYVNGAAVDTNPADVAPGYTANPFTIGAGGGFSFQGRADEVSIYDRSLSAAEISSIYNAGQSGKCKPSPLNPAANQIAWFTGDGDARDFAGEDQNGTFAANNYAVGKVGQSFRFDGVDDFVAAADDNALDITGDITLEAWINPIVYNTTIISKRDVDNSDITYVLFLESNGTLAFASRQNGVFVPTFTTTTTVPLNQFSHVAATIEGTTLRLYIDGIERGVSASYPTRTASDGRLTIGAFEINVVGGFYQGKIDEVSIYNRALSPSEIAAVYNAGTAGKLKSVSTPTGFAGRKLTPESPQAVTVNLSSATVTFDSVTAAGFTSQSGLDLGLLPALPSTVTTNNLNYDLSTSASYTGNVTVCFNVPAIPIGSFTETNILHLENGAWVNALPNTTTRNYPTICGDFSSLSPFAVVQGLAPSAASVKLSGRVTASGKGGGVADAVVYLTDQTGNVRTARASSFGYYEFDEVEVGRTYIINAYSRRYQFSTQIVSVTEETTVNLTANE